MIFSSVPSIHSTPDPIILKLKACEKRCLFELNTHTFNKLQTLHIIT